LPWISGFSCPGQKGLAWVDFAESNQSVTGLFWQDFLKLRNQGWQIEFDCIPEDCKIDAVVAMNKPVPHADNFAPGDLSIFFCPAWLTRPAASPMISTNLIKDSSSSLSLASDSGPFPAIMATASRAWLSMCKRGTVSSCLGILDFPFSHDIGTEIAAYESRRVQIDFSADNFTEFEFKPC